MDRSQALMRHLGATTESLRLVDYDVARGVYPDMTEHGWDSDDWPREIWPKVLDADILVIGGPLWLGDNSSVTRQLVERLYAMSGLFNDRGQYIFYGKTAGVLLTGNEDGAKHAAMSLLYSLQHIGYVIPPAADAGWLGEIGPGPSYLDPDSGGPENDFTNRNTTFMTWNLLHVARLLKDAGGIPALGNVREQWDKGERFGFDPNPEYR
jgi:multimeric flavodoxin WrbA